MRLHAWLLVLILLGRLLAVAVVGEDQRPVHRSSAEPVHLEL
jgi:hypothetical protein